MFSSFPSICCAGSGLAESLKNQIDLSGRNYPQVFVIVLLTNLVHKLVSVTVQETRLKVFIQYCVMKFDHEHFQKTIPKTAKAQLLAVKEYFIPCSTSQKTSNERYGSFQ